MRAFVVTCVAVSACPEPSLVRDHRVVPCRQADAQRNCLRSPNTRTQQCVWIHLRPILSGGNRRHTFQRTMYCPPGFLERGLLRCSRRPIACARSSERWCARAACDRSDQCNWMPSLRSDRLDGRCRCCEASARAALTAPKDSRSGSRLRHRRDEGRRQMGELRKAT
jgi:hypothetical protein